MVSTITVPIVSRHYRKPLLFHPPRAGVPTQILTHGDAYGERHRGTSTPEAVRIFYPRGYVVLAFRTSEAAEQVQQSLLDGGYAEDDIKVLDTQRVLEGATADL